MFRRLSPLFAVAFVLLPLGLRAYGFIYIPGGAGDVIGSRPRILHPHRQRRLLPVQRAVAPHPVCCTVTGYGVHRTLFPAP